MGNWVDLIIILVLIYYAVEGVRHGFFIILADFISFLASLFVSLRFYKPVALLLSKSFSLDISISNAVSFLLTAIVSEALLGYIFGHLLLKLPEKLWKGKWSKIGAVFPALGEGFVIISFILTFALVLPIKPSIKADIKSSKIGGLIVMKTKQIEGSINDIFGGVIDESINYLTIEPKSGESIPLEVKSENLVVDEKAETDMFNLVNDERKKADVGQLVWDPKIVVVSRAHATDMWQRKYFSHISPEGKDVGDRLSAAGIKYTLAGENLALAPSVTTAHTGLMNSAGHRANILEPNYKKVGIGVIDNGIYGKMFVQVFTD